MMTAGLSQTLFVALLSAPPTADMAEVANASGCFICHQIERPDDAKGMPLAPPYVDVAKRYKEAKDAKAQLTQRILEGSRGKMQHWKGKVNMEFMPPNVNVNDETAAKLAEWILGLDDGADPELVKYDEMLGRARNSGCMACHAVRVMPDKRFVPLAPAFEAVSAKYGKDEGASKKLTRAVIEGTMFREWHWEKVNMRFMPPNVNLTEKEASALVEWILALK